MNLEASSFDAASASQVRLKDAYLGGLKEEQQGNLTHEKEQNSGETSHGITSLLLKLTKLVGNHLQEKQQNPSLQLFRKVKNNKEATLEHFFAISPQTLSYTEAVYDMVRKIYRRPSDDPMEDLDLIG